MEKQLIILNNAFLNSSMYIAFLLFVRHKFKTFQENRQIRILVPGPFSNGSF